jgi:hypothetical protein
MHVERFLLRNLLTDESPLMNLNLDLPILAVRLLALTTVTAFGGVHEHSNRRLFASESSFRFSPYFPSCFRDPPATAELWATSPTRYRRGHSDFRGPSSHKSDTELSATAAIMNQDPTPPPPNSSSPRSLRSPPPCSADNHAASDDSRNLYVTIGPPCSGKTTWLRSRFGDDNQNDDDGGGGAHRLRDVALDDQPGIYVPVAISDALPLLSEAVAAVATTVYRGGSTVLRSVILGRSVVDRLRSDDNRELGLVLLRLALRISSTEFAQRMLLLTPRGNATTSRNGDERGPRSDDQWLSRLMIEAVEEVLSRQVELHEEGGDVIQAGEKEGDEGLPPWMPATMDLFVQDRIFRSESAGSLTGIDSAHHELRRACRSQGRVAWGNTNTRPREYKEALQLASETGRPVHFVTYYDISPAVDAKGCMNDVTCEKDVISLSASLKDLLLRNLERLLRTGRYVPSLVIHTMHSRSQNLVKMVMEQWISQLSTTETERQPMENASVAEFDPSSETKTMSKFEFDRILARLANYEMKQDRTVVPRTPPKRQSRGFKPSGQASQPNNLLPPPRGTAGPAFGYQGSASGNAPVRRPWDKMPRRERPMREVPAPGSDPLDGQQHRAAHLSPELRPPQKVRKSSWTERGDAGVPR